MFRRTLSAASVLAFAGFPALAQDVKYEKYKLDNGMTVILHEDHRLPVATINTWFRVGAKEEPPRRSGFAHLFEHLMFMGTERVPGNDFDNIMEAGGGDNNASTILDRTNYFSQGPAELLPTLLWLDADRLEDLGRMMNQDKLDKQRDVVRNERRQTVENTPYGKADDRLYQLLYPQGHPYYYSVIGTHEDLEAATVTNVKDFFATFYVPNNASLVVAGDFDSAAIKPLIQKLFGTLTRGGDVVHREPKDVPLAPLGKVIRATMLDKVDLPRTTFCYQSPTSFGPGDAEMDLFGAVLSQGKSSRLYKRLVLDEKLASSVSAGQDSAVLGSMFRIDVYARPNMDLSRIEQIVDEELDRALRDGISPGELEQRKTQIELDFLSRMDSLGAIADRLNEYEYYWGEPNSFKRDLDRYRTATPETVRDWARKILTPGSRIVLRVLPEEPQRAASESPRAKNPGLTDLHTFTLPKPETFTLDCGLPVMLWSKRELPMVSATLIARPSGGGALDPADKAGLAYLTAQMLGEGAGDLDAIAFADALQSLGARFGADASHEAVQVHLTTLKRTLPKAAGLFGSAVLRPRMTDTDYERVLRLHKDELEQDLNEPGTVAARVAARVLFGDAHPYSRPSVGRTDTVSNVALADVKAMHSSLFSPQEGTLLIAGDVTPDEAKTAFSAAFAGWKSSGSAKPRTPIPATPAPTASLSSQPALRVFIVDRPEAVQTVIRFATPGPRLADQSRPVYEAINTILGGSFTSRLNQNLREVHGYTYGARSRFFMEPSTGWFTAYSAVRADVTGAGLAEFLKEFDRFRSGDATDEEITKSVKTLRTETIQSYSTLPSMTAQAAEYVVAGLSVDTAAADLARLATLKAGDLNAAARAAIPIESGILVLVGDRTLILEQIKDITLPKPVELRADGSPVHVGGVAPDRP